PWLRLPLPPAAGGLAALRNADGLIELFLRDKASKHLLVTRQSAPGSVHGPWRAITDMGFAYSGQPTTSLNEHGKVLAAALNEVEHSLWLVEEGRAVRIGEGIASTPSLYARDGVLHVAARAAQDRQAYWLRARSGGAWGAATVLEPPPAQGGTSFPFAATLQASVPAAPTLAAHLP
ncbi:MAG: hypothetical protein WBA83_03690, partial [Burkholderiaceae bacterium]